MKENNNDRYYFVVLETLKPFQKLNACSHLSLGMGFTDDTGKKLMSSFRTQDGIEISKLTDLPYIILKASRKEDLNVLRERIREHGLFSNAFLERMFTGTVESQLSSVAQEKDSQIEDVVALAFRGPTKIARRITKDFSML